jgi:uncharacterized protein
MLKKKLVLTFTFILLIICLTVSQLSAQEFIGIGTGSTGGAFYPIGVAIATIADEEVADYEYSAHSSGGSAENLEMLMGNEIGMGIVGAVPSGNAYNGEEQYEGRAIKNIRSVTALHPEVVQLVYRKNADIESLEDFAGKSVTVGPPGGGGSVYCPDIFKTLGGFTFDDIDAQYLGYDDSVHAMTDRLVDAAYLASGYPTSSVTQLYASPVEIGMIEFTDEELAKMQEVAPYYTRIVIPAGTYPEQEEDLNLMGFKASLIAREDIDEEAVYGLLEAMYLKRFEELQERHHALSQISLEEGVAGLVTPLHVGAVKFYQDQGIEVPENLIPPEMK